MSLCALVISIFSKGVALGTQSSSARRIKEAVNPRIIDDYMLNYIQTRALPVRFGADNPALVMNSTAGCFCGLEAVGNSV